MAAPHTCADTKTNGQPCPCRRFKKPLTPPDSGPELCLDCLHIEGAHPLENELTSSGNQLTQNILKNLRPAVNVLRLGDAVSPEDAKAEALSRFRPTKGNNAAASGSSSKVSGSGKRTSEGKLKGKQNKSSNDEPWIKIGTVVLFPDGLEEHVEGDDDEAYECKYPSPNACLSLRKAGLLRDLKNTEADALRFKSSWSTDHIDNNFMRRLFPDVFGFIEREMSDAVESGDILWALMARNEGSRGKVMVLKKELVTGEDLRMAKTPDGRGWKDQTLYFGSVSLTQSLSVLRKTIPDHTWRSITDEDSWDSKTLEVYDRVTGLFEKKTATSSGGVASGLGGAKSLGKRKRKGKTNAKARAKVRKDVKGKGKARVVDSESEDTSSSEMGDETGDESPSESTKVSSRGNILVMLKRLQFAEIMDLSQETDTEEEFPLNLTGNRAVVEDNKIDDDDVEILEADPSTTPPNLPATAMPSTFPAPANTAYTSSSSSASVSTSHLTGPSSGVPTSVHVNLSSIPVTISQQPASSSILPTGVPSSSSSSSAAAAVSNLSSMPVTTSQPPASSSIPPTGFPSSSSSSSAAAAVSNAQAPMPSTNVLYLPGGSMTQAPHHYSPRQQPSVSPWFRRNTGPSYGTVISGSPLSTPSTLGSRPTSSRPGDEKKPKFGFRDPGKPDKNPWKKER
ncbi:uncharacterized protein STEHIDRAFT_114792 [Stereum hirsutum FP-91666 SS1]|uniref:uncharacterized protein n=1 Tax=Stereum hirsutum (strain FP-91666) TaxID=721885 RepID=UPI0004449490|nr:uncharacterized protein STEHIDRAFT_114792 [Stereum hirsutum FP-91666 SS1]EIM82168.1 hypothetical protein STEHIDRAFT_114792 [Stereum hirsutum FP-91666 SS1]